MDYANSESLIKREDLRNVKELLLVGLECKYGVAPHEILRARQIFVTWQEKVFWGLWKWAVCCRPHPRSRVPRVSGPGPPLIFICCSEQRLIYQIGLEFPVLKLHFRKYIFRPRFCFSQSVVYKEAQSESSSGWSTAIHLWLLSFKRLLYKHKFCLILSLNIWGGLCLQVFQK